jgi:hypothetical protein
MDWKWNEDAIREAQAFFERLPTQNQMRERIRACLTNALNAVRTGDNEEVVNQLLLIMDEFER